MFGGRFLPGFALDGVGPANALRPETVAPATATPVAARNFLRDRGKTESSWGFVVVAHYFFMRRPGPCPQR